MNGEPSPFEPDAADELLSADLDGELDAAAHDLGMSVAEIRSRLDATPGVDARRAALTSARDLLVAPPELDELVAARMRAAALAVAPGRAARPTRHRPWGAAAGIAAAVAVAVGLVAVLGGRFGTGDPGSKSSQVVAAAPAPGKSTVAPVPTGPLGAFADARALATAAAGRVSSYSVQAPAPHGSDAVKGTKASTGAVNAPATSTSAPAAPDRSALSQPLATSASAVPQQKNENAPFRGAVTAEAIGAAARVCTAPASITGGTAPALRTTATLAGVPVVVLVYVGAHRTVVIEDARCSILDVQPVG